MLFYAWVTLSDCVSVSTNLSEGQFVQLPELVYICKVQIFFCVSGYGSRTI